MTTRREKPWWATVLILALKITLVILLGGVPVFLGRQAADTAYRRGLRNGILRRIRRTELPRGAPEPEWRQWNADMWGVPPVEDEPKKPRLIQFRPIKAGCHGAQEG